MPTLDELVRQALADEARNGPSAVDVIARVLREEGRPAPRRRSWLQPLAAAAAVGLIAAVAVLLPRSGDNSEPSGPVNTPTTTVPDTGEQTSEYPGYLTLSAGKVHIALPVGYTAGLTWSHDCPGGVLDGTDDAYACAGRPRELVYEVLLGPGRGDPPADGPNQHWGRPDVAYVWKRDDTNYYSSKGLFQGQRAVARVADGEVRYPCADCASSRWRPRQWVTLYFPQIDGHYTIVGPKGPRLDDLREYISLK